MGKRIAAIGECMVELSPAGPGLYRQGFAGDTFNTAWHLRRALPHDWTVSYVTAVGDDATSDAMLAFMDAAGIETTDVQRLTGAVPGLYMIDVDACGERHFAYWRGQSAARRMAEDATRLRAALASADVIYASGISLAILPPTGRKVVLAALAAARARGAMVVFDSNIRPRLWEDPATMAKTIVAARALATVALPTWPDEQVVDAATSAKAVLQAHLAAGAREVVVKLGADGALISEGGASLLVPCPAAIAPVDTTGAGDSFNAGYVAARLTGADPAAAVLAGHRLAGQVIQHRGALLP